VRSKNGSKSKRSYEKPKLRVIELTAEEVLGMGCKTTTSGGGPLSPTCACSTPGT